MSEDAAGCNYVGEFESAAPKAHTGLRVQRADFMGQVCEALPSSL